MADVTGGTPPTNASPFAAPADMKALYDHFGAPGMFSVSTASSLPPTGNWEGRRLWVADDKASYVWSGSAWSLQFQDWKSWTPTLTGMSLGNGVVSAKYQRIGKRVAFKIELTWGSSSSASGSIGFSAPVTPSGSFIKHTGVGVWSRNIGTAYPAQSRIAGGSSINVALTDASVAVGTVALLSNTYPATPATGDTLYLEGSYEVA